MNKKKILFDSIPYILNKYLYNVNLGTRANERGFS